MILKNEKYFAFNKKYKKWHLSPKNLHQHNWIQYHIWLWDIIDALNTMTNKIS